MHKLNFMQAKQERIGMVLNMSEDGGILKALFAPTGDWVPEAGAIKEFNGVLYLGGDFVPTISTLRL